MTMEALVGVGELQRGSERLQQRRNYDILPPIPRRRSIAMKL